MTISNFAKANSKLAMGISKPLGTAFRFKEMGALFFVPTACADDANSLSGSICVIFAIFGGKKRV